MTASILHISHNLPLETFPYGAQKSVSRYGSRTAECAWLPTGRGAGSSLGQIEHIPRTGATVAQVVRAVVRQSRLAGSILPWV